MKRQHFFLLPFSFFLLASVAAPTVTSFTQDPDSLEVTVEYTLDTPAIITADFQKNDGSGFKSIGDSRQTKMGGDVNRYIETTGAHSFVWTPDEGDRSGESVTAANFKVVLSAWSKLDPPDYCAVNLCVANSVFYYTSSNAVPGGVLDDKYKTEFLLMRRIPAKGVTWKMGSPESDPLRNAKLETQHEVTLTEDYWMAVFPITQGHYCHFYQGYGNAFTSYDISPLLPVAALGYAHVRGATSVCDWPNTPAGALHSVVGGLLDKMRYRTGVEFDLPTEAQWEYACRAGTATQYNMPWITAATKVEAHEKLAPYAWMSYNNEPFGSGKGVTPGPVGHFLPNAWGLYDMHGTIQEWCLDYIDTTTTASADPVTNPMGPTSGTGGARVARGGSYNNGGDECRSAYRRASTEITGANAYHGCRVMAPIGLKW